MAKGHAKEQIVPYWFATEAIEGAGGLRSNLADTMKYLRAQVGRRARTLNAPYAPRTWSALPSARPPPSASDGRSRTKRVATKIK